MNILDDELNSLGDTEEQVASTLRKLKITGELGNTWLCPIVMFLKKNGFGNCIVDKTTASAYAILASHKKKSFFAFKADLPQAVKSFVANFDDGLYPEFIKHNE